jgi:hypothetical protein
VAAYDNQGNPLGVIGLDQITKQPRNEVYRVKISKGVGEVDWRTTRPTDQPCCPTVDAAATFTFDPATAGLKAGQLTSFNETTPAGSLLEFTRNGDIGKKAQALASLEILDAMITANRDAGSFESLACYGPAPTDASWPKAALAEFGPTWPPPPDDGTLHGDRFCLIKLGATGAGTGSASPGGQPSDAPGPERYALLGMEHVGFRAWRAVDFRMPGTRPGNPGIFGNPGNPGSPGNPRNPGSPGNPGNPGPRACIGGFIGNCPPPRPR